jgi:hypothetical protein
MFEFDCDQASGLRAAVPANAAAMMPVASTSRPGLAYELLCTLATQLSALGRDTVIIDGSAQEVGERRALDGSHLGLIHALQDSTISGLGTAGPSSDWLVMPGAMGLQALQQTALAAGAGAALSRLLSLFAARTVVLLYAPANTLSALLAGVQAQVMVPVLALPQATIDAYGSLKLLHAAGLSPVLAPMESGWEPAQAPLGQVVRSVSDCAERHLDYPVPKWACEAWGLHVQEAAIRAPWLPGTQPPRVSASSGGFHRHTAANPTRWS